MFEKEIDKWLKEEMGMKNALFKFVDLMEDLGHKVLLDYGTLLGAARNQRLVPCDTDVDVSVIIHRDTEKDFDIFGIVREAHKRGFKRVRFDHYYSIDYHKRGEWCKHPEILKLPLDEQTPAFMKLEKDNYYHHRFSFEWNPIRESKALGWVPHLDCWIRTYRQPTYQYYANYLEVKMYGRIFRATINLENRLSMYGERWREMFCSYKLWQKYHDEIKAGVIPEEVRIFMREFKERDKLWPTNPTI